MTTARETAVGSALLYLAIDLGPRPAMRSFAHEVEAVNALWWYCTQLVSYARSAPLPPQRGESPLAMPGMRYFVIADPAPDWDMNSADRLLLARTKLASPWASLLTTVAEKSTPIGYGVAALWAMQRLLTMIMDWQRHRLDLQRGKRQLSARHDNAQDLLVSHASAELAIQAEQAVARQPTWSLSMVTRSRTLCSV